jgi:hypothetical protein
MPVVCTKQTHPHIAKGRDSRMNLKTRISSTLIGKLFVKDRRGFILLGMLLMMVLVAETRVRGAFLFLRQLCF